MAIFKHRYHIAYTTGSGEHRETVILAKDYEEAMKKFVERNRDKDVKDIWSVYEAKEFKKTGHRIKGNPRLSKTRKAMYEDLRFLDERKFRSYSSWKIAIKKMYSQAKFEGNKDVAFAFSGEQGLGEWDGVEGVIYEYADKLKKNPAYSERQRKFACTELGRRRRGKKTITSMTERQLKDYCRKNPEYSTVSGEALAVKAYLKGMRGAQIIKALYSHGFSLEDARYFTKRARRIAEGRIRNVDKETEKVIMKSRRSK